MYIFVMKDIEMSCLFFVNSMRGEEGTTICVMRWKGGRII